MNVDTGERLADNTPIMVAVNHIWDTDTTYAERKAFIEVTCNNSRSLQDIDLATGLMQKIQKAVDQIDERSVQ